ncbi:histone-binding protein N1/N2-like [Bufo gargarizans]|uniref:histone-binding protein N1/N2-like n=1 Tax=Bufo gargarizans TaxID=30331 RepID=UPI001CF392C7|nr:histone-binding protein N1/N2-like [Bufo gargarizans]
MGLEMVAPTKAEKKMGDVSAEPVDGADVDAEDKRLMALYGQDLVMKDISSTVNALQKASSLLGKKYGETNDQYEDPIYYDGLALLNSARKENNILGEPMEKIPEDDESSEDPGVPSTSNLDEKEEEGFRLEVYDAVSEKDEKTNKVNEDSKGDSKAEKAKADELEKSSDIPETKVKAGEGSAEVGRATEEAEDSETEAKPEATPMVTKEKREVIFVDRIKKQSEFEHQGTLERLKGGLKLTSQISNKRRR